jgi:hypothetical protein
VYHEYVPRQRLRHTPSTETDLVVLKIKKNMTCTGQYFVRVRLREKKWISEHHNMSHGDEGATEISFLAVTLVPAAANVLNPFSSCLSLVNIQNQSSTH